MLRTPDRTHPYERNPSIACAECGESYRYQEYWMQRYVEGVDCDPRQLQWFCDECLESFQEWRQQREHEQTHRTLEEWSE